MFFCSSVLLLLGYRYGGIKKYNAGIGVRYVLHDDFDFKSKYLLLDIHVCSTYIGEFQTNSIIMTFRSSSILNITIHNLYIKQISIF